MELTYDNRSRVKTQSTVYGRASYMDKMAYDTDGHLSEVVGHSNYKYAYDENGNAISVFEHDEKLLVSFDIGDRVIKVTFSFCNISIIHHLENERDVYLSRMCKINKTAFKIYC